MAPFGDEDQSAACQDEVRRQPRAVARHLVVGAAVTVVSRPVTWVLTFGFVGPSFGLLDYLVWDASRMTGWHRPVIQFQWALPVCAVVVALLFAVRLACGTMDTGPAS
ncbi:hypothetical protein V6U90_22970 [Micromonospora sp. CPCC 206060]|uniref:hypothetical protein n=1 Tax=Micromonospora sp. CPCC 206060 TaxID=3122406 RepID=UPI002FF1FE88